MCTSMEIFKKARLGDIVRYSDGTPRPPERFVKKLATWKNNNGSGRLVRKEAYSQSGHFLALEDLSTNIVGIARFTKVFAVALPFSFEIVEPVQSGSWRVFRLFGGWSELEFLSSSREEAEAYLMRHQSSDLVLEEVGQGLSHYDQVVPV